MKYLLAILPAGSTSAVGIAAQLASLIALFVCFRQAAAAGGLDAIGAWALVQGVFLLSRIWDSGLGPSVTRDLAERGPLGRRGISVGLAAAATLTLLPVVTIGGLLFYPTVAYVSLLSGGTLSHGRSQELVAFAMIQAVIASASLTVAAVLEGVGYLAAKSISVAIASAVLIAAATTIAQRSGINSAPILSVAMMALQLVAFCAVFVVALARAGAGLEDHHSYKSTVGLMFQRSASLSAVGIIRLGLEPVAKMGLATVGSLSDIGIFDLAVRLTTQVRSICQSAVHPLLYFGARVSNENSDHVRAVFIRAETFVVNIGRVAAEALILSAPAICYLAVGHIQIDQLISLAIVTVAMGINIFGFVGYYAQLSTGSVNSLLWLQVQMSALNIAAMVTLAKIFGPYGVIMAYALAFIWGGLGARRLLPWKTSDRSVQSVLHIYFRRVAPATAISLLAGPIARSLGNDGTAAVYALLAVIVTALNCWGIIRSAVPLAKLSTN